jgi:hypothetical protein
MGIRGYLMKPKGDPEQKIFRKCVVWKSRKCTNRTNMCSKMY